MGRRKKPPQRNLYYLFPVSSKALKRKFWTQLLAAVVVGCLLSALMFLLLHLLNR